MAEFAVRLSRIDDTDQSIEFPIKPGWLSGVLEGTDVRASDGAPGTLSLRLYRTGPDIIVGGAARATLVVACSRCLEDVMLPVSAELSLVMSQPPKDQSPEELELSGDDVGREYYSGDELVFDDIVRDHLLLELPMQPVCTDPPCPEWVKDYLTTADEAEAKAAQKKPDPRLAPLAGLADKLKPKA